MEEVIVKNIYGDADGIHYCITSKMKDNIPPAWGDVVIAMSMIASLLILVAATCMAVMNPFRWASILLAVFIGLCICNGFVFWYIDSRSGCGTVLNVMITNGNSITGSIVRSEEVRFTGNKERDTAAVKGVVDTMCREYAQLQPDRTLTKVEKAYYCDTRYKDVMRGISEKRP